tara:strand:- start:130 stop:612 length:483 start_codon:yes stop_codon:yes gene_type:complete
MTEHRYPVTAIAGDLIRALIGAAVTCGPVVLLSLNPWFSGVLLALTVLFAYFGVLTVARSRMRIVSDEQAVAVLTLRERRIDWCDLDGLRLNYYRTGSRSEQSWMQLVMKSGRRTIKVDSRVSRFDALAERADMAARRNQLVLDDTTMVNMRSLRGVKLD